MELAEDGVQFEYRCTLSNDLMSNSVVETFKCCRADYQRYADLGESFLGFGGVTAMIANVLTAYNHCFTYSFWMRMAGCKCMPIRIFAKLKHRRLSRLYGIQIPPTTKIGKGFYIGHGTGIVVNPNTVIGDNCNISQNVTIGSTKRTPAEIGNNVYIGPNVCIVEHVIIGDNAKIGAGAVVIKDVPAGATCVGNPGRNIER